MVMRPKPAAAEALCNAMFCLITLFSILSSTSFLLTSLMWNLRPQAGQILKKSFTSLVGFRNALCYLRRGLI